MSKEVVKGLLISILLIAMLPFVTAEDFVQVSGTGFTLGGSDFKFIGTNAYYLADYANNHTYDDDGNLISNSKQYVLEILDEAQANDLSVIRTWAFGVGDTREPYGGQYNLYEIGNPGNYSEDMFKALDWVVYQAKQRDLKLMLVLVNNWDAYGGMSWYVSRSPTANQGLTGDAYHDQFYTDAFCKEAYKNFTGTLINRTNVYTGVQYKNEPTIMAWMLANEPRAKSDGNRASGLMENWVNEMSAYVQEIDTNHLVTTGIEGWGTPWEGTSPIYDNDNSNIDFVAYASYPDSWEWFPEWGRHSVAYGGALVGKISDNNPSDAYIDWWSSQTLVSWNTFDPSLGSYGYDNWIQQQVEWATSNLGKPVVLQETNMNESFTDHQKGRYLNQSINTFFSNGGDGYMFWTLNHDNYYYSTNTDGDMDDGYGFYVSDDSTLTAKSAAVFSAIDYAHTANGGNSYTTTYADNTVQLPASMPSGFSLNLSDGGIVGGTTTEKKLAFMKEGVKKVEFFIDGNVNLNTVELDADKSRTVVKNLGGLLGVAGTHTLYLPVGASNYVKICPDAQTLSDINETCPGKTRFSYTECQSITVRNGYTCAIEDGQYKLSGLTGSGAGHDDDRVPEFSDYALILAIALTLSGLFFLRKR